MVGLGLNLFMLAGSIIRRRRKAVEKPE
jgi:hypothetical protein